MKFERRYYRKCDGVSNNRYDRYEKSNELAENNRNDKYAKSNERQSITSDTLLIK